MKTATGSPAALGLDASRRLTRLASGPVTASASAWPPATGPPTRGHVLHTARAGIGPRVISGEELVTDAIAPAGLVHEDDVVASVPVKIPDGMELRRRFLNKRRGGAASQDYEQTTARGTSTQTSVLRVSWHLHFVGGQHLGDFPIFPEPNQQ
jgi:hypothetical protein